MAAIFHEKQTWNCLCFCKSFQRLQFCLLLSFPEPAQPWAWDERMSLCWFMVSGTRLHSADTLCSCMCLPWQILSLLNTINAVSIKRKTYKIIFKLQTWSRFFERKTLGSKKKEICGKPTILQVKSHMGIFSHFKEGQKWQHRIQKSPGYCKQMLWKVYQYWCGADTSKKKYREPGADLSSSNYIQYNSIVADDFHWTFPHYMYTSIIPTYTIIELLRVFHSILLFWPILLLT